MTVMDRRALVLGGGGVTGIAWELGLLAGLRTAGLDLTTADTVIGTSAILAAWAVLLGGAALAPGNWVNYVLAALILLPLVAYLPFAWWHRRRQARAGGHNAADR